MKTNRFLTCEDLDEKLMDMRKEKSQVFQQMKENMKNMGEKIHQLDRKSYNLLVEKEQV